MKLGRPFEWSDDRIAELKRLWDSGLTAREAAAKMGLSRSAVIGKVHRLGLEKRGVSLLTDEDREKRRRARNAIRNERLKAARALARGDIGVEKPIEKPAVAIVHQPLFEGSLNIPFADLRPFSQLSANQCRYIADEPPGPLYLACGTETLPGESWCGHCRMIVMPKSNMTQPERLQHIRVGVVNHMRSQKAA